MGSRSPVKTDTKMLGSGKMRLCVLLALISVIVTMPRTQEEDTEDVQMLEEEDMRQLLNDLFISSRGARQLDINDEDSDLADVTDEADEADEASDDEVMEDSEAKMKSKEDEVSRFNNYIDAIYRRMNAALRAKMMDPMTLNLDDRQKKKQSPRRSLNKREADGEDDDDDDDYNLDEEEDEEDEAVLAEDELQSRAGKPERAGKNKPRNGAAARRNKKNKKSKKGEKEQKGTKKAEREAAKKEKQEKKSEEKKKKKAKNTRQSRSGDKAKKRNRKQNKNKNEPKMAQKKNKKNENRNKGRTGSARNNEKSEKMMGSLSGIATLRREGDVVEDEENHKVITSEFHVGPLQLEVSKMYGKGQGRTIKSAKAITEVMSGTMTLKVKPDGSAHVRKVVFKEPENVDVKGSLSDNKPRNLRYLKNSVNKMRPLAAIRVLKTARYVLKTPGVSSN